MEKEKEALETEKEALEDKKSALEELKTGYQNAVNSIQDLIDWTQKYIEQTKNDEIDVLEEKKSAIDDLIDKQKELLEAEKDEYEWNKEISEKQNTVASNALSAAVASLDDSSAGRKAAKEANDTLNESRNDIKDSLYEHELELREDAFDKLQEKMDDYYDNQINSIQDYLNDEVALYKDACNMIDNDSGDLYGKLLTYCQTYTTTTEAEFNYMWSSAQQALQEYNIANLGTFDLLNNLQLRMYDVDNAIDVISDNISSYEGRIDSVQTKIDNLSQAAKDAANDIQNTIDLSNQQQDSIKPTWYYDWEGKRYQSVLTDKDAAIHDILSQIEEKYGGVFPSGAVTIYGTIKKYASGTTSAKGGLSLVGENGAELRLLNQGDGIIPADLTQRLIELGSDPVSYLSKAYNNVLENLMSQSMLNSTIEEMFGKLPNISTGNAIQNTNSISPTINVSIQGDATQSTVKALQAEANKIVDMATKNVMNIALKNKNII